MAFPTGWPPRRSSGVRSLRVYKTGTTTADYEDNAFFFTNEPTGSGNILPLPYVERGSTAVVTVPETPLGGGQDPHDNTGIPMVWSNNIRICNDSTTITDYIEYSFDGINTHGSLAGGEQIIYRNRYEAGIAIRSEASSSGASTYRVEAW